MINVYDGDTIMAYGQDITIKVRLFAIDAPELTVKFGQPEQPFSKQAKEFLAELILKKEVDIHGYGLDPYNHILGIIYVDGKNVNLEMIKAGLAEISRSRSAGNDIMLYRRAEIEAQAASKGIWSVRKYYISPKEWRMKHGQQP
ncbi:MAG: thermonuclease family protein [Proteobacteria bacterium]|nr:thermonuclease family protein [Pseudomonadota bacterium]